MNQKILSIFKIQNSLFYRFRDLVDYYKKHHDGLEIDVEKELNEYKVFSLILYTFTGDKNISILYLSYRTSDLQF